MGYCRRIVRRCLDFLERGKDSVLAKVFFYLRKRFRIGGGWGGGKLLISVGSSYVRVRFL